MNEHDGSSSLVGMSFDKLNGTNYKGWVSRMRRLLQRESLWDLTTNEEVILRRPELGSTDGDYEKKLERYQDQRRRIQKAVITICLAMTDQIADNYEDDHVWSTPGKIWKDINKRYETAVTYDAQHLQKELYQCRLEEEGTVLNYLNKIDGLCNKFKMCNNSPTDTQIIFHILDGLPDT